MPTVFVIGEDWNLRSLVRAELREHGVDALGMDSADDAGRAIAAGPMPSAMVLDLTSMRGNLAAFEPLAKRIPVIVVMSPGAPAPAWAAAVMPRPVTVGDVVSRVEAILKGLAA
jgi:DNA-binding NtrC family response regulator